MEWTQWYAKKAIKIDEWTVTTWITLISYDSTADFLTSTKINVFLDCSTLVTVLEYQSSSNLSIPPPQNF